MSDFEEIGPAEAHRRLGDFSVVDVRAAHEFEGPLGRIAGSMRVPMAELVTRASSLPEGRPLLMVCRSGNRSGKACQQLVSLGIGPVTNLSGGLIAWNRAALPVERSRPESAEALLEQVAAYMAQVGPFTPSTARDLLRDRLEVAGAEAPTATNDAVGRVLDYVEQTLGEADRPADLDLSLAAFRDALAAL